MANLYDHFPEAFSVLPIHLNTIEHALRLSTFINLSHEVEGLLEHLSHEIAHDGLRYEVWVLPAEPGTFLKKLGIAVIGGYTALFTFIESDVGSAFIEGLTGKSPSDWSLNFGEHLVERALSDGLDSERHTAEPQVELAC